MVEEAKLPEKILPVKNCVRYWEALLFHDKAFLSVETTVIIEATIKHLEQDKREVAREISKELLDLSFRHNPIGKQRIDNFVKWITFRFLDDKGEK